LLLILAAPLAGPVARAESPKQWAVLIGVQTHDHLDPKFNLKFTGKDVTSLRRILEERAGLPAKQILQLTDDSEDGKPTLANLRKKLPTFLGQAGEDDRVLVFYSGHGFPDQDQDRTTYLVPRDFDLQNVKQTGLPIGDLRQALNGCKAKVKFLILDCCHAGSTKAIGDSALASQAVAKALTAKQLSGCVVLASCLSDEESLEWPLREQGVFTYWLCRALEGAAAKDGKVTIDEVERYVSERVRETAEQLMGSQHPVRLNGANVTGAPLVLELQKEPPESLCPRLAAHMDLDIRRKKLKRVGVLEFVVKHGADERLATAISPAYYAELVQKTLRAQAGTDYAVLDMKKMQEKAKDLRVEAVDDWRALQQLGEGRDGPDAVVVGTLRPLQSDKLELECLLQATASGETLARSSGVLPPSADLVVFNQPISGDYRQAPTGGEYDAAVIQYIQDHRYDTHPLLDPSFPFTVEILARPARAQKVGQAGGWELKRFVQVPVEEGAPGQKKTRTELVMPVREREVFKIHVVNRYPHKVAMTLLVDGLNTLGQERERPGKARCWVLDADSDYEIPGWTEPLEEQEPTRQGQQQQFKVDPFVFVDVAQSVAAGRQKFGDSIGLITAVFYGEWKGKGKLGVGRLGKEEIHRLETEKFRTGQLLGVVQIRYADENDPSLRKK
jgi:uncharacterized caspase-like protein